MGRTGQKAAVEKEKTLFPGNKFVNTAVMAALIICFALYFTTARSKSAGEVMRWQKEASFERCRLENDNRAELAACSEITISQLR